MLKRAALPITLLVAASPISLAIATPATAEECVAQHHVWVHVQYEGKVTGRCATTFATAYEALHSTGLTTDTGTMITTVDNHKADERKRQWWAVWTKSTGAPASWQFAQKGVKELELKPGSILGMFLEKDWNKKAATPAADPLASPVASSPDSIDPKPDPATGGSFPAGTAAGIGSVVALVVTGGVVWWRRRSR